MYRDPEHSTEELSYADLKLIVRASHRLLPYFNFLLEARPSNKYVTKNLLRLYDLVNIEVEYFRDILHSTKSLTKLIGRLPLANEISDERLLKIAKSLMDKGNPIYDRQEEMIAALESHNVDYRGFLRKSRENVCGGY